ncbi:MAG: hypothetical protein N2557_06045 [Hydrogenophilus sp.]|nr:hypothetical protein [Hydrogenophilus sp.]
MSTLQDRFVALTLANYRIGHHPYYIFSLPYLRSSAGVRALHFLCSLLNHLGYEAYMLPPKTSGAHYTPEITQSRVLAHFEAGRKPIVVYPEIIEGHPVGLGLPVRWLLYFPGIRGGPRTFPPHELRFTHEPFYDPSAIEFHLSPIDFHHFSPPPPSTSRDLVLFYRNRHRGPVHAPLTPDVEITPTFPEKLRDLVALLQRGRVLFSYETSALLTEARLCGCPVVLLPHSNNQIDHPHLDNPTPYGIAYGDTLEAVAAATATVARAREAILERFVYSRSDQIARFITLTQEYAARAPWEAVWPPDLFGRWRITAEEVASEPSSQLVGANHLKTLSAAPTADTLYLADEEVTNPIFPLPLSYTDLWRKQLAELIRFPLARCQALFTAAQPPRFTFITILLSQQSLPELLPSSLASLDTQIYSYWTWLVIADIPQPETLTHPQLGWMHLATPPQNGEEVANLLTALEQEGFLGDWVAFLLPGTTLEPTALLYLADLAHRHPQAVAFTCDTLWDRPDGLRARLLPQCFDLLRYFTQDLYTSALWLRTATVRQLGRFHALEDLYSPPEATLLALLHRLLSSSPEVSALSAVSKAVVHLDLPLLTHKLTPFLSPSAQRFPLLERLINDHRLPFRLLVSENDLYLRPIPSAPLPLTVLFLADPDPILSTSSLEALLEALEEWDAPYEVILLAENPALIQTVTERGAPISLFPFPASADQPRFHRFRQAAKQAAHETILCAVASCELTTPAELAPLISLLAHPSVAIVAPLLTDSDNQQIAAAGWWLGGPNLWDTHRPAFAGSPLAAHHWQRIAHHPQRIPATPCSFFVTRRSLLTRSDPPLDPLKGTHEPHLAWQLALAAEGWAFFLYPLARVALHHPLEPSYSPDAPFLFAHFGPLIARNYPHSRHLDRRSPQPRLDRTFASPWHADESAHHRLLVLFPHSRAAPALTTLLTLLEERGWLYLLLIYESLPTVAELLALSPDSLLIVDPAAHPFTLPEALAAYRTAAPRLRLLAFWNQPLATAVASSGISRYHRERRRRQIEATARAVALNLLIRDEDRDLMAPWSIPTHILSFPPDKNDCLPLQRCDWDEPTITSWYNALIGASEEMLQ